MHRAIDKLFTNLLALFSDRLFNAFVLYGSFSVFNQSFIVFSFCFIFRHRPRSFSRHFSATG